MANGEEVGRSYDDTTTGNNRPPAGGKRQMMREGGSASRVSIKARPRDPGGGTVSTDPRRRIVLYDVIVSVEQPREEPTLAPIQIRQHKLDRLWLRTLIFRSVLMM